MTRYVLYAVLPTMQHWLRSHVYLVIYVIVCTVAWAVALGVTR